MIYKNEYAFVSFFRKIKLVYNYKNDKRDASEWMKLGHKIVSLMG